MRKSLVLSVHLTFAIAAGCSSQHREAGQVRYVEITFRDEWTGWDDIHFDDLPRLPILESDLREYPREHFGFVWENNHGSRIDSFNGLVTKDMVVDPDITIALHLSEAELDTLYLRAIEFGLFEYPEPHPLIEYRKTQSHSGYQALRIRAGKHEREFRWLSHFAPGGKTLPEWKRMHEFIRLMQDIVQAKPEYQSLPQPRSGYQ